MNIILLEKVGKLGNLGDQVNVRGGFARNYLIPYGKAVPATKSNIETFEARRAELLAAADAKRAAAQARADKLSGLTVTIGANAGDEGKLFGSIGTRQRAGTPGNAVRSRLTSSSSAAASPARFAPTCFPTRAFASCSSKRRPSGTAARPRAPRC